MTTVIIAGPRTIIDYELLLNAIKLSDIEITEVVSGNAKGVDSLGERYAKENNIPLKVFPSDWKTYKKAAGPIRNLEMAQYAQEKDGILLAIWDKKTKGTKNMLNHARKLNLDIKLFIISPKS